MDKWKGHISIFGRKYSNTGVESKFKTACCFSVIRFKNDHGWGLDTPHTKGRVISLPRLWRKITISKITVNICQLLPNKGDWGWLWTLQMKDHSRWMVLPHAKLQGHTHTHEHTHTHTHTHTQARVFEVFVIQQSLKWNNKVWQWWSDERSSLVTLVSYSETLCCIIVL